MRLLPTIIVLILLVAAAMIPVFERAIPSVDESKQFRFVSSAEHNYLDPQMMTWMHDIRVADCLFESLVKHATPSLTLEPGNAESWDVSPDGKTYTFHLRRAARWSNGDPVTASDYLYTWRRAVCPDTAADYSSLFFNITGVEDFFNFRNKQLKAFADSKDKSQEAAQALWDEAAAQFNKTVGLGSPDPYTLVVHLDRPVPYFLELACFTTFVPVHEKSVEAATFINSDLGMRQVDPTYWSDPSRLVSNGPYVLKRRRFKRDVLLVQNPYYWNKDTMGNTSILEVITHDAPASLATYKQGDVDWLPDLPSASQLAADLVKSKWDQVHRFGSAGTYFYNFNCKPALPDGKPNPLVDPRVRRALSLAINRRELVEKVTRVEQPIATTFTPVGAIAGYEPPVEPGEGFNPELAKKLLAEAGYPDPKTLTGLTILYNTGQGHENIATAIKAGWAQTLGVEVGLEGLEVSSFKDRMKKQNYTITRASWFGDYRDPTTFLDKFVAENGNNDTGYTNAEFNNLMKAAADESDVPKRMAMLSKAEGLMLLDQPIAPIYQYVEFYLFDDKKVTGLDMNAWKFHRLEKVHVNR
jgi:oligopeptide transport system substrate-binding protein